VPELFSELFRPLQTVTPRETCTDQDGAGQCLCLTRPMSVIGSIVPRSKPQRQVEFG